MYISTFILEIVFVFACLVCAAVCICLVGCGGYHGACAAFRVKSLVLSVYLSVVL